MADEIPDLTGKEERTDHDLGIVRENLKATDNETGSGADETATGSA